jgi:hypothetical protein
VYFVVPHSWCSVSVYAIRPTHRKIDTKAIYKYKAYRILEAYENKISYTLEDGHVGQNL